MCAARNARYRRVARACRRTRPLEQGRGACPQLADPKGPAFAIRCFDQAAQAGPAHRRARTPHTRFARDQYSADSWEASSEKAAMIAELSADPIQLCLGAKK